MRRWEMPDEPLPQHPYRNSAIFHFVLACLIVVVAWATGGGLGRAFGYAVGFFVLATGWSWWRWRQRLDEERRRQEQRARHRGARPARRESP
jgi:membrane protein implicated in regulation of membrane protease activity